MVLAGSVQVAAEPVFDEAPSVWDPAVTPRTLTSAGGPVKLAVSAFDLRGISDAYATVTGPGGVQTRVQLEGVSSDRFEGTFNAPPNTGTGAIEYSVEMSALDDIGQQTTVSGGVFTVAGRPSGRLEIKPASYDFGTAQVGKRKQHSFVIRNLGARTTAPVAAVVDTSGAPFFVTGASSTGRPFCLRGGESLTVHAEFRPTVAGLRTGTLRVRRPDLVQPALSVPLRGTGVTRTLAAATLAAATPKKVCAS